MTRNFLYLFDPLCGWCYGASAGVDILSLQSGVAVKLLPMGLFAGEGARALDASMASHIWAADQRIGKVTGAIFSERYRDQLLADGARPLDSGQATLALTAVSLTAPTREREALSVIQRARYIDGRDIGDPEVLAELLAASGLTSASAMILDPDASLTSANQDRIGRGKALMLRFGLSGVPSLLRDDGRGLAAVDASHLYQDPLSLVSAVAV